MKNLKERLGAIIIVNGKQCHHGYTISDEVILNVLININSKKTIEAVKCICYNSDFDVTIHIAYDIMISIVNDNYSLIDINVKELPYSIYSKLTNIPYL